jgi:Tol biopolymer transport system component
MLPVGSVELLPLAEIDLDRSPTAVAQALIRDLLYHDAPLFLSMQAGEVQLIRAANWRYPAEVLWASPDLNSQTLAISWDGLHIILGMHEEVDCKLYVLVNGIDEPVRLTSGPGDDSLPTISPDKATVAFLSDRSGGGTKLYTLRMDSHPSLEDSPFPLFVWESADSINLGVPSPVLPGSSEERSPCYGPGGLAFLSNALGTWDLWLLENLDTSVLRRVLVDVDEGSPVSWVGERLFVIRNGDAGLVTTDGLAFQPLEGSTAGSWGETLAPHFAYADGVLYRSVFPERLTPDLAFFRHQDEESEEIGQLWLTTLEGAPWLVADRVSVRGVSWSPDGQHLAYMRRLERSSPLPSPEAAYSPDWFELWVADADGTNAKLIHMFDPISPPWEPAELQWDPEGDRVFFSVAGSPTHREIWSIRIDGSDLSSLTWGWDFQALADGRVGGITRGLLVFLMDIHVGPKVFFASFEGLTAVEFSPHGRYTVGLQDGALYLLDWETDEVQLLPITLPSTIWRGPSFSISWIASGEAFSFAGPAGSGHGIYTYDTASEEIELLAMPTGTVNDPRWSPDGQELAFIRNINGTSTIWSASADAEWDSVRQIVEGPIIPVPVVWYPGD